MRRLAYNLLHLSFFFFQLLFQLLHFLIKQKEVSVFVRDLKKTNKQNNPKTPIHNYLNFKIVYSGMSAIVI